MSQIRKEQLTSLQAHWNFYNYDATGGVNHTDLPVGFISTTTTKVGGGNYTTDPAIRGVVTTGSGGYVRLKNTATSLPFVDSGATVFGRIVVSNPGVFTVYYKKITGSGEQFATLPSGSQNVDMIYTEVMNFSEMPANVSVTEGTTFVSGAISRTFINVKDFGAKGDNSTNDYIAINNAISAITASGGTIFFPAGTYLVGTTITITNSNITLLGENRDSVIIKDHSSLGNHKIFFIGVYPGTITNNIRFEKLTISNGTAASSPSSGKDSIRAENVNGLIFIDCLFTEIQGLYAIIHKWSSYVTVERCRFYRWSYAAFVSGVNSTNVKVENCEFDTAVGSLGGNAYCIANGGETTGEGTFFLKNAWYKNNYIINSPVWEGIDCHGGENIWIVDNYIENCHYAIQVGIANTSGGSNYLSTGDVVLKNVNIIGNRCIQGSGAANGVGILVTGDINGSSGTVLLAEDIKIQKNKVTGFGVVSGNSGSILVYTCKNIDISKNVIDQYGQTAIGLYYSVRTATIVNNVIYDTSTALGSQPSDLSAIYLFAYGLWNIFIDGNKVMPSGVDASPKYFVYAASSYINAQIGNNEIHKVQTGLYNGAALPVEKSSFPTSGLIVKYNDFIDNSNGDRGTWKASSPKIGFGAHDITTVQATVTINSGSKIGTITSATPSYSYLPEGMNITIAGAGVASADLNAIIIANNGVSLTLDTAASSSVVGANVTYQGLSLIGNNRTAGVVFPSTLSSPTIQPEARATNGTHVGTTLFVGSQDGETQTGSNANNNGGPLVLFGGAPGLGGSGSAAANGTVVVRLGGRNGTNVLGISTTASGAAAITSMTVDHAAVQPNYYADGTFFIASRNGAIHLVSGESSGTPTILYRGTGDNVACTMSYPHNGAGSLTWALGVTSVTYTQNNNTTNSATAAATTIQAQNATGTTSIGGALNLISGTGTSTAGAVNIQVGGTTEIAVTVASIAVTPASVSWIAATSSPTITQAKLAGNGSTAGQNLTIKAQSGQNNVGGDVNNNGGNVILASGPKGTGAEGGGTVGSVQILTDTTPLLTMDTLNGIAFDSVYTTPMITQIQKSGTGATASITLSIVGQPGQNQTGGANNNNGGNISISSGTPGGGGGGTVGVAGDIIFNSTTQSFRDASGNECIKIVPVYGSYTGIAWASFVNPVLTQLTESGTGNTAGVPFQILAQAGQNASGGANNNNGGSIELVPGAAGTGGGGTAGKVGNLSLFTSGPLYNGGGRIIYMGDSTSLPNNSPASGLYLFSESGDLKVIGENGSSGLFKTTLASAGDATNPPTKVTIHKTAGRASITGAATVILLSYVVPVTTTMEVYARVWSTRTGGAGAGAVSDASGHMRRAVVRRASAGNVTLVGTVDTIGADKSDSGSYGGGAPVVTIAVDTGTQTVRISVTGVATINADFAGELEIRQITQ